MKLRRFWAEQHGVVSVEYLIVFGIFAAGLLVAVAGVGRSLDGVWGQQASFYDESGGGGSTGSGGGSGGSTSSGGSGSGSGTGATGSGNGNGNGNGNGGAGNGNGHGNGKK